MAAECHGPYPLLTHVEPLGDCSSEMPAVRLRRCVRNADTRCRPARNKTGAERRPPIAAVRLSASGCWEACSLGLRCRRSACGRWPGWRRCRGSCLCGAANCPAAGLTSCCGWPALLLAAGGALAASAPSRHEPRLACAFRIYLGCYLPVFVALVACGGTRASHFVDHCRGPRGLDRPRAGAGPSADRHQHRHARPQPIPLARADSDQRPGRRLWRQLRDPARGRLRGADAADRSAPLVFWPLAPAADRARGCARLWTFSHGGRPPAARVEGGPDPGFDRFRDENRSRPGPALVTSNIWRLRIAPCREHADLDLSSGPKPCFANRCELHAQCAAAPRASTGPRPTWLQPSTTCDWRWSTLAERFKVPMLLGMDTLIYGPAQVDRYNSAVLVSTKGQIARPLRQDAARSCSASTSRWAPTSLGCIG